MSRKNTKKIDAIIIAVLVLICVGIGLMVTRKGNDTKNTQQPEQTQVQANKEVTYEDYIGKRVGILTGSSLEENTLKYLPDSEYSYYDTLSDLMLALSQNKIDCFVHDEPVLRMAVKEHPDVDYIKKVIKEDEYAFAFQKETEKGATLQEQFNEMLAELKKSGELDKMKNKWFGDDESVKTLDSSGITGENGNINVFVVSTDVPFCYVAGDNELKGYAVELIYMFSRKYGYKPNFDQVKIVAGLLGISTGIYDIGASNITVTEERKEAVCFSEPVYHGGIALAVRTEDIANQSDGNSSKTLSYTDYAGKKIGVCTGMILDVMVKEKIPDSEICYFNGYPDIVTALSGNAIDAFATDEPVIRYMEIENPELAYIKEYMDEYSYGYCFAKTTEGKELCDKFSEYIKKLKADGTLAEIDSTWFGNDKDKQILPPLNELSAENGTLKMALQSVNPPFVYMKDGRIVGYDVDIAYRFCKEHGYGLELVDMNFEALINSVQSGMCDFAASCMTITEERSQSVYFSEPNYLGGAVIAVRKADIANMENVTESAKKTVDWRDYNGKKIGIITGTSFEEPTLKNFPDSEFLYYNSYSDINAALDQGLIDGYVGDEPALRTMHTEQPQIDYIKEMIDPDDYAFAFQKDTEKSKKLCAEFNEFLEKCKADGTLEELNTIWFGTDESKKVVDFSEIENNPEKLKVVTNSTDTPFSYIKDGKYVGYAMALAVKFCKEYGYSMDIEDVDFSASVPGLVSGKYDMCVSSLAITPERAESVLFSEPFYNGGIVLAVRSSDLATAASAAEQDKEITEKTGFFKKLKNSFEKNFIREDRWKLIAQGILTTIIITVFSTLFGTILAFLICIFRRTGSRLAVLLSKIYVRILQGTPIVVLLMILYYIVFGKTGINAVIVAVIGFSLNLAAYVSEMMRSGIESIDPGQREAALALGFTERQAFYKFIFPQAATRFLPVYKGEIISLLKNTSVVGYIAIQDLTKMSDIIRSRTYEAFFPLIATALIYFALAWLITFILGKVEIGVTPKERKKRAKN
ncbi:MAG: ABC transporter permease subunit [Firmicutes bacterium]|nr:ABC transporter permease subunit [Bacillota bacterium]